MKNYQTIKIATGMAMLVLLLFSGCAKDEKHSDSRHQGPPPEAIKACEDKQVGDSVKFTGRRGEKLTAVCKEMNGTLAAVPEGMPPEGPQN
jgi:hypothetical protein